MTVNIREAISLMQINAGATIIKARYLDNNGDTSTRRYAYKNVLKLDLAPGDLIIVESRDFYAMVEVTDIDVMASKVGCSFDALKHVVSKVDMTDLRAVKDAEDRAAHAMAMAEVNDRLANFERQLGRDKMAKINRLLTERAEPVTETFIADCNDPNSVKKD